MGESDRDELVRAAWRVLERSGFEGFKVQLVLREAGVSARAFYRHFADKDELMLALLRDEMIKAGEHASNLSTAADDPAEQVALWLRAYVSAASDPRRVARAKLFSSQQSLIRRFPSELDESGRQMVKPLLDALIRGAELGVFPLTEPERDANVIGNLASGTLQDALVERPDLDIESLVSEASDFVMRALGATPAGGSPAP
jgi:AcrR family transcriptional regulator